jgi:hypothetical protein
MRTRFLLAALLLALPAASAPAQVTQAKFDSVKADVEMLKQILGAKFNYPRPTSSIAADLVPANTLPTGQYPYILSDYQIRVGLASGFESLQRQIDAAKAQISVLDARPSGSASVVAAGSVAAVSDDIGGGHFASLSQAQLFLKANTLRASTQGGITSPYCGLINQNGWDGGLRFQQNMKGQASFCTPELPGGQFGGDSRFAWSYSQYPDDATAPSIAPNQTYGQSFVLDGGFSQAGYSYVTGAQLPLGVLLAAQRGGQSMYFGITPVRGIGEYPTNKVPLALIADNSNSPVQITASGAEGRIGLCPLNGVRYLCLLDTPRAAPRSATRSAAPKQPVLTLPKPTGRLPEIPEHQ